MAATVQWNAQRLAMHGGESVKSSRVLHIVAADHIVLVADAGGRLALRNQKQSRVLQAATSQDEVFSGYPF
jgi:hypothetical protein